MNNELEPITSEPTEFESESELESNDGPVESKPASAVLDHFGLGEKSESADDLQSERPSVKDDELAEAKKEIAEQTGEPAKPAPRFSLHDVTEEQIEEYLKAPSSDGNEPADYEKQHRLLALENAHWTSRANQWADDSVAFKGTKAGQHYELAVDYLLAGYINEFTAQGFNGTEIQDHVTNTVKSLDAIAIRQKKTLPELIYGLAAARGFKPYSNPYINRTVTRKKNVPAKSPVKKTASMKELSTCTDAEFEALFEKVMRNEGSNNILSNRRLLGD